MLFGDDGQPQRDHEDERDYDDREYVGWWTDEETRIAQEAVQQHRDKEDH